MPEITVRGKNSETYYEYEKGKGSMHECSEGINLPYYNIIHIQLNKYFIKFSDMP